MRSQSMWRAVAVFALVGWGATAGAWYASYDGGTEQVSSRPSFAEVPRGTASTRRASRPVRWESLREPREERPDLGAVRAALREEVRAELQAEREQRHREHEERRLGHLLDRVARFAEANDLSDEVQGALEEAVLAMHDRMEELRPSGPPEPGGPPPELREAFERSFDQLDADVYEVLQDEALVERFHASTRPGPPGPPGP